MSTHRRGISATQWPVADLLRREGRPWPRLSPAARGLVVGSALLCSTVVAVSMAGEPDKHDQPPPPEPHSPPGRPPGSPAGVAPNPTPSPSRARRPPCTAAPRTSGVLADGPGVVLVPPRHRDPSPRR